MKKGIEWKQTNLILMQIKHFRVLCFFPGMNATILLGLLATIINMETQEGN